MPFGQPRAMTSCQLQPLSDHREGTQRDRETHHPEPTRTALRQGLPAGFHVGASCVSSSSVTSHAARSANRILRSVDHAHSARLDTPAVSISRRGPRCDRLTAGGAYLATMCGLLALLCDPARSVTDDLVDAVGRRVALMRHRGPDEPGTWPDDRRGASASTGCRSSTSRIRTSRCAGVRRTPRTATRWSSTARSTTTSNCAPSWPSEHGADVRHRGRRRGHRRGLPPLGRRRRCRRLRGMFAFAIWDTVAGELFCARDPFGIKPLFMATGPGGTAFGSEKKSLLELAGRARRRPDHRPPRRAALHGAAVRAGAGDAARRRPPARVGLLCPGPARPGRRGHPLLPPRFAGRPPFGRRTPSRPATTRSPRSWRTRSPSTCAPTSRSGAFLSGGIDSTAIAALAMRHNPKLITFTTGFEREGYSEVDVAVESAEAIGARHVVEGGQPGRVRRRAARDRLVPRRTGRRPGAGAAVLHRPRGPQARQGGALRRGRRRAVRRLHHLPGTVVAASRSTTCPGRCGGPWARRRGRCRRGCAARACCTAVR